MKKSEALHEGYLNGLKTAQKLISKMLDESILDVQEEINEWCEKVNGIIKNVNEISTNGDEFDTDYYNDHIPVVSLNEDGYDLSSISYDSHDDMLYIVAENESINVDLFNFSLYFRKAKRAAHGNMVFKNVEASIKGDEPDNINITVYLA